MYSRCSLRGGLGDRLATTHANVNCLRFIINDTYRSDIPLVHPPYLVAISALFLAVSQPTSTRSGIHGLSSSISDVAEATPISTDIVGFLAGLNVSMAAVATVIQDIFAMYVLWDRYKEDDSNASNALPGFGGSARGALATPGQVGSIRGSPLAGPSSPLKRSMSTPGTPMSPQVLLSSSREIVMTPGLITFVLTRMREQRFVEFMGHAHVPGTPTSAHALTAAVSHAIHPNQQQRWTGMVVNKRLERAQQAG
jgi:cyclin C